MCLSCLKLNVYVYRVVLVFDMLSFIKVCLDNDIYK